MTADIQAAALASGWIGHFRAADLSILWGNIEHEYMLPLDDKTLLLGKVDANGWTEDGEEFFADWKTLSPYNRNRMDQVKEEYRLDPQMLTYGLLASPISTRFMVRWALKTTPPTYHHAWYRYTDLEVANWRLTLLKIADNIRRDRADQMNRPWITNYSNCLRYGKNYACPFYRGCLKQDFTTRHDGLIDRVSHLQLERELANKDPELVVLNSTRVDTWLGCQERYRREYEDGLVEPPGDALQLGTAMHDLLARYYTKLKGEQL